MRFWTIITDGSKMVGQSLESDNSLLASIRLFLRYVHVLSYDSLVVFQLLLLLVSFRCPNAAYQYDSSEDQ